MRTRLASGQGEVQRIFILRQEERKILEESNKSHWIFVDLETAFDRVGLSREVFTGGSGKSELKKK